MCEPNDGCFAASDPCLCQFTVCGVGLGNSCLSNEDGSLKSSYRNICWVRQSSAFPLGVIDESWFDGGDPEAGMDIVTDGQDEAGESPTGKTL